MPRLKHFQTAKKKIKAANCSAARSFVPFMRRNRKSSKNYRNYKNCKSHSPNRSCCSSWTRRYNRKYNSYSRNRYRFLRRYCRYNRDKRFESYRTIISISRCYSRSRYCYNRSRCYSHSRYCYSHSRYCYSRTRTSHDRIHSYYTYCT